jgi:hypothetical protein
MNKKTGVREKQMKQVVVGKLKVNESFGEMSVTLKEPMSCSIVTETPCRIGIISCDRITRKLNLLSKKWTKLLKINYLKGLGNITMRLLLQTSNRTFGDLTQDEIYKKFIEQEKKKEWKTFKSIVIRDVMDKYGIDSGTGKYSRKESSD